MTGSVFKEKVMSDLNMTIGMLLNFYRYILGPPPCFQSLPVNVLKGNFLEDMPYKNNLICRIY